MSASSTFRTWASSSWTALVRGDWLNSMLTNNVDKLDVGTGQYTFLLNDRGGIIDDLIVYRIDEQKYLLVVNAARADEDFAWLQNHLKEGAISRSPAAAD